MESPSSDWFCLYALEASQPSYSPLLAFMRSCGRQAYENTRISRGNAPSRLSEIGQRGSSYYNLSQHPTESVAHHVFDRSCGPSLIENYSIKHSNTARRGSFRCQRLVSSPLYPSPRELQSSRYTPGNWSHQFLSLNISSITPSSLAYYAHHPCEISQC